MSLYGLNRMRIPAQAPLEKGIPEGEKPLERFFPQRFFAVAEGSAFCFVELAPTGASSLSLALCANESFRKESVKEKPLTGEHPVGKNT